jgi:hypothetical protein
MKRPHSAAVEFSRSVLLLGFSEDQRHILDFDSPGISEIEGGTDQALACSRKAG